MNKIINHTTVLFALVGSSLFANEQDIQDIEITNDTQEIQVLETIKPIKNSFRYVNLGMEFTFSAPYLGLGYRAQKDHHGLDLSASMVLRSIDSDYSNHNTRKKVAVLYNYFFKPNLESQYYAGLGVAFNDIDETRCSTRISSELVAGRQYKNKGSPCFMQLQVSLPSDYIGFKSNVGCLDCHEYIRKYPFFTLTYGIGF